MKKLLVFLTVLVVTGVANGAAIEILVNGETYVDQLIFPSDIITVTWVNDEGAGIWGGFGDFTINVSNGDQVGNEWILQTLMLPTIAITPKDEGYDVFLTGSGMPMPEGAIAGWEFHVPDYKQESDYIIIDPLLGTWFSRVATPGPDDNLPYVVLHVIPEPMTVALLGLGGLFLLRRRK
jgi:hypothetical protein